MPMRRLLLSLFALVLLGGAWSVLPASAFTLQPALFDVSINPGSTFQGTLSVSNDETAEQTYFLSIQKFVPKGEMGQQQFLPLENVEGLPQWIFLKQPSLTLRPGESRDIPFSIRVPEDALSGGYYAAIFFSTQPPLMAAQQKIVTGAKVGALMLVSVEGELVHRLRIADFGLDTPASIRSLPASFRLKLENLGNTHVRPEGDVTITNFFGSTVARLPINTEAARILPASARRFSFSWLKEGVRGGSGFFHEVGEEWRNFAIGTYTATLAIRGVDTESALPLSLSFSVWPTHLFICFIGLIVLVLIGLKLFAAFVIRRATVKPPEQKRTKS